MLYIIGFGPGGINGMTMEAKKALDNSQMIVGYSVYVELLKPYYKEKEFYSTPMKQEKERCLWALERAEEGKQVSLVCSGDSGIYGMASLIYELMEQKGKQGDFSGTEVKVIAGVTAASSGGAVLGAPLSHDFAVISLSDLMTPLWLIEKRIAHAAMSDMAICLYNPSSKKRADYLKRACEIVLTYQKPETVCGYVKNIGREGETMAVLSLKELKDAKVDMFTTVFIGNSATRNIDGKMVTPRGYFGDVIGSGT
ncbi:MAG: precorrin-3B C(17)-methyltransferase [Lachnospiraceae bacterium]|nr:precorrin-3B C(17)-methyltransferase [Lachnospiraceae bacterium]MCM1279462.1 precorrin-3B C(17)-methyltransferase [Robinsoniella sp.]